MTQCHPDCEAYRASANARATLTVVLILAWLSAVVSSEANLTISEFLARNQSAGFDEDGDSSDWLEIYNGSADPVNLDGWYLSDRADNLTKWSFPPVVINPDSYLVVFASGKDRRDPGGELHTNFKIGADGEYLGLVYSDGVTVADAYAPTFPPQFSDVSYGRTREIERVRLALGDSALRYHVPTSNAEDGEWTAVHFNDDHWTNGRNGLGYDRDGRFATFTNTDVKSDMQGVGSSIYARLAFDLTDPGLISKLTLSVRYDDGFAVYLNSASVASVNAPDTVDWTSESTQAEEVTEYLPFAIDPGLLQSGENVLALHGLNASPTSFDFLLQVQLVGEIESETVQLGFMAEPTPGWPNSEGFHGFTPEPGVTHEGGFFEAPISVSLLPDEATDIIYYTLDMSTPGPENSGIADGPIQISATSVLRAVANRLGHEPSAVSTHTYLFIDDVIRQSPDGSAPPGFPSQRIKNKQMNYGMDPDIVNDPLYGPQLRDALLDLPSVSIVTDPANLFDPETGIYVNSRGEGRAWERPASFELLHPNGSAGFQVNAGLRIRGGASRSPGNPKNSFRFIFRREYGPGKLRYPLFGSEGVEEFDKIDLRTNQNFVWHRNLSRAPENTFLRDVLSRDTERDMGHLYSRSRYYHLYLNGQYWGLFQSEERIDPDFAASYRGGGPGDYDSIKVDRGFIQTPTGWRGKAVPFEIYAAEGEMDTWRQIWGWAGQSRRGQYLADNDDYFYLLGQDEHGNRDPDRRALVDEANLIGYMLLKLFSSDHDGPISFWQGFIMPNNVYALYNRNAEDGFFFLTHDNEFAFHVTGVPEYDNRNGPWLAGETFETSNPHWLHNQMATNAEYRNRFADAAHQALFNNGVLTAEACLARMREREAQIELAIIAESARWGDTLKATPFTKADWEAAVAKLEDFLRHRGPIVVQQFREVGLYPTSDPPEIIVTGSGTDGDPALVSIEKPNPGGKVFLTLDGSDPREIGGAINPFAFTYKKPVALPHLATRVRARFWREGEWGVLIEAPIPGAPAQADGEEKLNSWRIMHFNEADLIDPEKNASVWGDRADPDRDNIPNLIEYYMGLDPNADDHGNPWLITVDPAGSNTVIFSYLRSVVVDASLCRPEWTKDLSASPVIWSSENITYRQGNNLGDQAMIEATVPIAPGDKAIFVRLRCE